MNQWKKKPLLDLKFCIFLVKEILFLSEKSRAILNRDVCGSRDCSNLFVCIQSDLCLSISLLCLFSGYTYLVTAFTLVDGRRLHVEAPLSDLVILSKCSLLFYNLEFTLHVDIFISLVTTCQPLMQRL